MKKQLIMLVIAIVAISCKKEDQSLEKIADPIKAVTYILNPDGIKSTIQYTRQRSNENKVFLETSTTIKGDDSVYVGKESYLRMITPKGSVIGANYGISITYKDRIIFKSTASDIKTDADGEISIIIKRKFTEEDFK